MSDANRAIVQRFYQAIAEGNLSVIDELVAEDFVGRQPGSQPGSREQLRTYLTELTSGLSDLTASIDDQISDGDRVATRATLTGTHTGRFLGMPASGMPIATSQLSIMRVVDGRIAESWTHSDRLGTLQQLGATAMPQAQATSA